MAEPRRRALTVDEVTRVVTVNGLKPRMRDRVLAEAIKL